MFAERKDSVFTFKPFIKQDIEKIIDSMKSKRSSGFDEVSNYLIKKLKKSISIPIGLLILDSMDKGVFPDKLKVAKVVPLFKSGDPSSFSNYRPISLLSVFSKIYEKVINNQVYSFFEEHIFSNTQFGFRKGSETTHSIMNFLHNICSNSSKKYHIGVFLDLKKAFDTVNHDLLLKKTWVLWGSWHWTCMVQKLPYKQITESILQGSHLKI